MLMINTILRNFLKRPATRKYPMVKRDPFSNYRGRLINNVESCIFCRMCSTKCPAQCISTDPKEAFWGYDPFSCVYCGICVEVCPTKSLFMLSTHRSPVPHQVRRIPQGYRPRGEAASGLRAQGRPERSAFRNAPPKVVAAVETPAEAPIEEPKPTPRRPRPRPPAAKKKQIRGLRRQGLRPLTLSGGNDFPRPPQGPAKSSPYGKAAWGAFRWAGRPNTIGLLRGGTFLK
mgnify:CR=1 FL=1